MASERSAVLCRARRLAILAAAVTLIARPSHGAPDSLRQGLFGDHSALAGAPPVARFVSEDGATFILDRSQKAPLLKFENGPEIFVLQTQPAPRGDMIYKNDMAQPVLRATRLGGLTVFTDGRPDGSAAALTGISTPIRLPALGPQALLERLAQASARASFVARRAISFEAEASPASAPLIADTAAVAAEAIVRISRRPDGRAQVARIRKVQLVVGKAPAASLEQGLLKVVIAPALGFSGRPSSGRIVAAALAGAG